MTLSLMSESFLNPIKQTRALQEWTGCVCGD